jgi:hypothetical protein
MARTLRIWSFQLDGWYTWRFLPAEWKRADVLKHVKKLGGDQKTVRRGHLVELV